MYKFDKKTLEFLNLIQKAAKKQNVKIFFVGGMVRDAILNEPLKDVDLIMDSDALNFVLPDEIKLKSKHKQFHTIKVDYNGTIYDIASTRTEKYPYSGCLPKLDEVGVKLQDDVKRRDFSINSLYCDISDYKVIDLVKGIDDINNKTLRVLHNKSYIDDPTRILRGIDFKHRFNFEFCLNDEKLINDYLKNPDIENSSQDRILAVFKKVLKTDGVFEELIERNCHKLIKNIKINEAKIKDIILKFNADTKMKQDFYIDILKNINIEKIEAKDDVEIYKKYKKIKNPLYYFYKTNDKNIFRYFEIKDIKLSTKGYDLIKAGYQGSQIGTILDKLLLEKIKNPILDEYKWLKTYK